MQSLSYNEAKEIVGSFSKTTKMPGFSIGISAELCGVGSKLRKIKGSVCADCYALKGMYRMPSVKKAHAIREAGISHPRWVEAFVVMLNHHTSFAVPYFRWHDAGDIRSVEHFSKICEIAVMSPHIRHWIPTRENKIISEYVRQGGLIPDNLCVRLSSPMVDQAPVKTVSYNTSTVHSNEDWSGKECQAYRTSKDGKIMAREIYLDLTKEDKKEYDFGYCGECRDCWSKDVPNVSYLKHQKGKNMEAIHLAQSAIITQQREELDALESLVIEYQETISNLKTRIHNYYAYGEQP